MDKLNTLELIDQMYRGEVLNYEKYETIYSIILSRGKKIKHSERCVETGPEDSEHPCSITITHKEFDAYYYMGVTMIIFSDGSFMLMFTDMGGFERRLHVYMNGDVLELKRQIEDYC